MAAGEFAEFRAFAALGHELLLVIGFLIEDQRFGGVFLDPLGVAHHEDDAEDRADDQDNDTSEQAFADGCTGKTRGDAGREGVNGRS